MSHCRQFIKGRERNICAWLILLTLKELEVTRWPKPELQTHSKHVSMVGEDMIVKLGLELGLGYGSCRLVVC